MEGGAAGPKWVIRYRNGMSALRPLSPCYRLKNGHCGMSQTCQQPTRPTIGFFVRDPAAVRLAPRFVNVKSCTAEVGEPRHAQGRFGCRVNRPLQPYPHFSIGGWIASSRAFGTALINSASASLKPEAA